MQVANMVMRPTPGITRANLSVDPLMTEEEATPGGDDYNPFDDPAVPESRKRELDLVEYSDAEAPDFELPGFGDSGGCGKKKDKKERKPGIPLF